LWGFLVIEKCILVEVYTEDYRILIEKLIMNEIYNKNNGKFFPLQFIYFGYFLFGFGIYLSLKLNILGFFFVLIALILSFSFIGIKINFKENIYKEYINIYGISFGKWKLIPKIQYLTIFIEKLSQNINVSSISRSSSYENFKINIIISETKRISIGVFKNKEEAVKAGKILAKGLKTKLLDNSSENPEWIDVKN